jgi:rare lipoprotein A
MKNYIYCLYLYLIISLLLVSCSWSGSPIRISKPPSERVKTSVPESYVVNGKRYYPLPDSTGYVETGEASWYGKKFHGHSTASGEIYDMHKLTAAHKTLPFGTYVKVINLTNNKYNIVRINDRGPFVKGRIIDLSYQAAKELLLIGPGVARVKVIVLGKENEKKVSKKNTSPVLEVKNLKTGEFTIQVGAFKDKKNATRLARRLKVIFEYVNIIEYINENKVTLYRLHVSKTTTLTKAGEMEKRLEDMGFTEAFIVRL